LLVGRLLHIWGFSTKRGVSAGRFLGMNMTFLAMAVSAVALLIRFVYRM
jgi:uncharacterized membrane protein YecN with MAPEG domain